MLNVISVYAPQVGRTLNEKRDFYAALDKVLTEIGSDERLMVCGNFNRHVGESIDDFEGVHGGSGFGARNLEVEVLLEFADSHSLVITNTCFTKVDSKKITSDSGGNRSVVDYILVRACQRQMVSDVTVINGEPCIQQHKLLLCKSCMEGQREEVGEKAFYVGRYRVWKLKENDNRITYQKNMKAGLSAAACGVDMEGDWNTLKTLVC